MVRKRQGVPDQDRLPLQAGDVSFHSISTWMNSTSIKGP